MQVGFKRQIFGADEQILHGGETTKETKPTAKTGAGD
jgi:hypothetical protein